MEWPDAVVAIVPTLPWLRDESLYNLTPASRGDIDFYLSRCVWMDDCDSVCVEAVLWGVCVVCGGVWGASE